jgi:hypothetical protein
MNDCRLVLRRVGDGLLSDRRDLGAGKAAQPGLTNGMELAPSGARDLLSVML